MVASMKTKDRIPIASKSDRISKEDAAQLKSILQLWEVTLKDIAAVLDTSEQGLTDRITGKVNFPYLDRSQLLGVAYTIYSIRQKWVTPTKDSPFVLLNLKPELINNGTNENPQRTS